MKENDKELADRFEARRHNPARLEKKATRVEIKRPGSHVVSVRMPTDEFLSLMDAVEASDQRVGDYVRGAIKMRLALQRMTHSTVDIMADGLKDVESHVRTHWSGNPLPYRAPGIPDFPPKGVADPIRDSIER